MLNSTMSRLCAGFVRAFAGPLAASAQDSQPAPARNDRPAVDQGTMCPYARGHQFPGATIQAISDVTDVGLIPSSSPIVRYRAGRSRG